MEKKQYDLCLQILKRFSEAGILKHIIVIGSWCLPFYNQYYFKGAKLPPLRTRDIDFLVPRPTAIKTKTDLPILLRDLGFVIEFAGRQGFIRLSHPDLIVEFLVQEKGRGISKPYPLPQLKMNAQSLRYVDLLMTHTITVTIADTIITLPHPAAYALHKFIIFKRRRKADKSERDFEGAMSVWHELVRQKKHRDIHRIFNSMHKRWQNIVIKNLRAVDEDAVAEILTT